MLAPAAVGRLCQWLRTTGELLEKPMTTTKEQASQTCGIFTNSASADGISDGAHK